MVDAVLERHFQELLAQYEEDEWLDHCAAYRAAGLDRPSHRTELKRDAYARL